LIRTDKISIRAGDFALSDVAFEVPHGAYGVLMGQTGSGKTTLVECICGLRKIDHGKIWLGDREVSSWRAADRNIGYVPQDGALFPNMTVRQHLSLSLEIRSWAKPDIVDRVEELAKMLAIDPLLERRPRNLSGGETQRVALGRALAFRPAVLLLDEPLTALDEVTREQTCDLLKDIQGNHGVTVLHVTQSSTEARRLADCQFLLREGRVVEQQGQQVTLDSASVTRDRSGEIPK